MKFFIDYLFILLQLIVCMVLSGYFDKEISEVCIEFLVKQCVLLDRKKRFFEGDCVFVEKINLLEFFVDLFLENVWIII